MVESEVESDVEQPSDIDNMRDFDSESSDGDWEDEEDDRDWEAENRDPNKFSDLEDEEESDEEASLEEFYAEG